MTGTTSGRLSLVATMTRRRVVVLDPHEASARDDFDLFVNDVREILGRRRDSGAPDWATPLAPRNDELPDYDPWM